MNIYTQIYESIYKQYCRAVEDNLQPQVQEFLRRVKGILEIPCVIKLLEMAQANDEGIYTPIPVRIVNDAFDSVEQFCISCIDENAQIRQEQKQNLKEQTRKYYSYAKIFVKNALQANGLLDEVNT